MNNKIILDWSLMILNLYSYYLIGNKCKIGFVLGLLGCLIGVLVFSLYTFSIPMIIMYVTFGILNITNFIKWSK